MKRKALVILLAWALVLPLSACGTTSVPSAQQAAEEMNVGTKEDGDAADGADANSDEAVSVTTGGIPWLDADIKQNVTADMSVDPKENYHLFVNCDWIAATDIPDGEACYMRLFSAAEDETEKKAAALFTDEEVPGSDAKLVRAYYQAVTDWDARNAAGLSVMQPTVDAIEALSSLDEVSDFLSDPEASYRVPLMVDFGNTASFNDSSRYITDVMPDGFLFGDAAEYRKRTEMGDRAYAAYKEKLIGLLTRLGYSSEEAGQLYEDMLSFETELAAHAHTSSDQMSPDFYEEIHNVYTREMLGELSPEFPLLTIMEGHGYDTAKEYNVENPAYVEDVNRLYTADNLDRIKAYLLVGYVNSAAVLADKAAYEAHRKCSQTIYGGQGDVDYDDYAYNVVAQSLPDALARAYLAKYDATKMKDDITQVCKELISAYHTVLAEEDWLSDETKEKAIEKLDAIRINAVYPDKWMYDYAGVDVAGKGYYEARKEVQLYEAAVDASHTGGSVDKDIWDGINILEANAFYNFQDNSINIIRGILEGDFYKENMSKEELLGGIGFHIGHEISHAFDPSGAQFDKDGNFADWWTDKDYEAFDARSKKLVAYYDKITAWEGQTVSGANIQGEAVADMGGVKALLTIASEEDDFDYDAFFTMFAKNYAEVLTPEFAYYRLTQDPHPCAFLRTNVTVQQFDEFYETYGIKEGDNMYLAPEERIAVW